jgi:hypothetical protein
MTENIYEEVRNSVGWLIKNTHENLKRRNY